MKHDRKKFAEILLKMSYHTHQLDATPDIKEEMKKDLNKYARDNSSSWNNYEENSKTKKDY